MKDSEVLRAARELITNEREFICWAIRDVVGITAHQCRSLKDWVACMLDGSPTYESWIDAHHPKWLFKEEGPLLEGRRQWLDWMIAYCEQEEAK